MEDAQPSTVLGAIPVGGRLFASRWHSCYHETTVVQAVVVKTIGINGFQRPQLNNTRRGDHLQLKHRPMLRLPITAVQNQLSL